MDQARTADFVDRFWESEVTPSLWRYMSIPCQSPAFDRDWDSNGLLEAAAEELRGWAERNLSTVPGCRVEIVRLPGRTPLLFAEIPGAGRPVLFYGHFDKQPPMEGWTNGRSAWEPRLEGERLYGRGGADDGYATYSAIASILAVIEQGHAVPPCTLLIEGCEESGSGDLAAYFELLAPRIGAPELVVALDAGCADYDQPWVTTSVRGQVAGTLEVTVLDQAMHSGDASGVVPSSLRIARALLARIEDAESGAVLLPGAQAAIPADPARHAAEVAEAVGPAFVAALPLAGACRPVAGDVAELLLNRAWRPQLTVTGVDGLPGVAAAAAVMHPGIRLKLSLRVPPSSDPAAVAAELKRALERDPPYGAAVRFAVEMVSPGWAAPQMAPWLEARLQTAAGNHFGGPPRFFGGGGGIPFLKSLSDAFPDAQLIVTGVLGPGSNAHGPDEFLHLPTAKRLTGMIAEILAGAADASN